MIEESLITYGPMGAMLIWFMIRTEKVINNNTKALDRNSETMAACRVYNNTVKGGK
jgi:hypothetical protein